MTAPMNPMSVCWRVTQLQEEPAFWCAVPAWQQMNDDALLRTFVQSLSQALLGQRQRAQCLRGSFRGGCQAPFLCQ